MFHHWNFPIFLPKSPMDQVIAPKLRIWLMRHFILFHFCDEKSIPQREKELQINFDASASFWTRIYLRFIWFWAKFSTHFGIIRTNFHCSKWPNIENTIWSHWWSVRKVGKYFGTFCRPNVSRWKDFNMSVTVYLIVWNQRIKSETKRLNPPTNILKNVLGVDGQSDLKMSVTV